MSHFDIYDRSLVNRMLIFGASDVVIVKDLFVLYLLWNWSDFEFWRKLADAGRMRKEWPCRISDRIAPMLPTVLCLSCLLCHNWSR